MFSPLTDLTLVACHQVQALSYFLRLHPKKMFLLFVELDIQHQKNTKIK